ncbi:MAG: type VI secretion system baseplate subunit TssF [Dyadobacter sp.]|uniref:type VI secretion system baseplate subunit TssF n=1 Tax=Dyadobacter sp. TaxID=1914288 RepID=UPI001B0C8355|nr:type VI secretion system baseplate subunit TssF [Dyadobacter sp.]MBO9614475.1 type VI secretion system baseplate subunit TssF [Dyadobacter sp.]
MPEMISYTKENISRRLIRRCAELWGIDDAQADHFDPLVRLLVEACSVEFEKVGQEIEHTELRLMTRLAEILSPETHNAPQPATAVVQARPQEPTGWIEPENQLTGKRTNARKGETTEVHFAPADRYPLVNAAIVQYVTPQGLFSIEKGIRTLAAKTLPQPGGEQSIWLGLEIDPGITSWAGFRFYFDWAGDPAEYQYREFLQAVNWHWNNKKLPVLHGLQENAVDDSILIYHDSFVRIQSDDSWEKGKQQTEPYPDAFEGMFDTRTLQMLKKPLTWIRITWPAIFPAAGFEQMNVSLNAFPVQNKQLNKITYRLQTGLNGIALPSGDAFMGIQSVVNQKNQAYTASEKSLYTEEETSPNGNMSQSGSTPVGSARIYTLRRQGIGRFDKRDARAVLYQLLELLRDEVTAFNAIGEDFLASILREIGQNMARIEQKLGAKKASETTAQPFLVIRGDKNPDVLFISYWSTLAEQANGIPAGTRLQSYAASGVSGADITMLTRSSGGKSRPDEGEYVNQLRKNIVTRNRLVTLEDMRAFCTAELGDRLRKVQVKPHFMPGKMPGQGFVRCLQIGLTPASSARTTDDWARECELLQLKVSRLSTGMYPIQVVTLSGNS